MSKEANTRRTLSLKEKAKERLSGFTNLNRSKSKSIEVPSEQKENVVTIASITSRPRSWLAEIEGHVFENPLSLDNLDITASIQETVNRAVMSEKTDNKAGVSEDNNGNTQVKKTDEKKRTRHYSKPHGTKDYEVTQRDTLNSIAAKFDTTPSELVKLNKLILRTIIPGQVLYVPVKLDESAELDSPVGSPGESSQASAAVARASDQHSDLSDQLASITRPRSPSSPVMSAGGYFEEPSNEPRKSSSYTDLAKAAIAMSYHKLKLNNKPEQPLVRHMDRFTNKGPGIAARKSPDATKMESGGLPQALSEEEARNLDEECLERFIKVSVKYITDGQGVVSGVLLVTPNAIMFDPNVSDPLVLEHGADMYGMIAPMETIISAAIYHDIAAMKIGTQKNKKEPSSPTNAEPVHHEVYHTEMPKDNKAVTEPVDVQPSTEGSEVKSSDQNEASVTDSAATTTDQAVASVASTVETTTDNDPQKGSQESQSDKTNTVDSSSTQSNSTVAVETAVDMSSVIGQKSADLDGKNSDVKLTIGGGKEAGCDPGSVESGIAEMHDERSVTEEGGATKSPPTSASMSRQMQIGNITYFQYNDEVNQQQQGNVSDDVATIPDNNDKSKNNEDNSDSSGAAQQKNIIRRTIGSITSLAGSPNFSSIVDFSSGLFTRSQDDRGKVKDVSEVDLAAAPPKPDAGSSNSVARKEAADDRKHYDISVESAIKLDDKPELFKSLDGLVFKDGELIPKPATLFEDPPLYLCLRVGKPINRKVSKTCPIESYSKRKKKPEYWFSIPKERVDHLYAFFVQWSPDIYGGDDEIDPKERGFVVIEEKEDEELDIIDGHFSGSRLVKQVSKDWEIVKVEEARRRLSLVEDESLPLPDMNNESTILKEEHIRKLNKYLPPRTVGYPWSLIYSTDKHGFSLKSLYRLMPGVDSPILLVVKDTSNNIFGAMVSCALRVSDHFYGTGESFLFTFYPEFKKFDWSGENNFFIKGNLNSLSIGAGQGVYGLWLDGDIYHGHTQKCATYDNDILTAKEDFVVKGLEAWGFV